MEKQDISKILLVTTLITFLVISLIFIGPTLKPMKSQRRASELRKVIVEDDNTKEVHFEDENGNLTFAADVRYASRVITKHETGELEEYFDEKGLPALNSSGYYGVYREYNDKGEIYKLTYLGVDNKTTPTLYGFSSLVREFDQNHNIVSEHYYDNEGKPTCTSSYGYGKTNEYDEDGNIIKITYLDAYSKPMVTALGYAIVVRSLYYDGSKKGKVETEFYFDTHEKPIALPLGHYGVHMDYNDNGQITTITYLDQNGKPTVTSKGYTTIKRTYHADNYIETERYYDLSGQPISLAEGQFGFVRDMYGRISYLNSNGGKQLNIKKMLYNHSWTIILCAITIVLISSIASKKMNWIIFGVYMICIVYITLMYRPENQIDLKIDFFWSIKKMFTDSEMRADILKNIWLFIPLGTILFRLYPKHIVLIVPVLLSFTIEAIQYFTSTGFFEFVDIVSNSIGGIIGYAMGVLLEAPATKFKCYAAQVFLNNIL